MFTEQEINLLLKQDEASLYEALGRSVDSGRFQHIYPHFVFPNKTKKAPTFL